MDILLPFFYLSLQLLDSFHQLLPFSLKRFKVIIVYCLFQLLLLLIFQIVVFLVSVYIQHLILFPFFHLAAVVGNEELKILDVLVYFAQF
jgi:hypothetical protein